MVGDVKIDTAGIGNLISGIGSAAKDIRAAITGKSVIDADAQAALEMKLAEIEQSGLNAQALVNQAEASNPSVFVSGWRPFLGWCLSICAGVYFLPRFILGMTAWTILAFQMIASKQMGMPPLPDMGWGDLASLLGGLLGLSIVRAVEKSKGVARI